MDRPRGSSASELQRIRLRSGRTAGVAAHRKPILLKACADHRSNVKRLAVAWSFATRRTVSSSKPDRRRGRPLRTTPTQKFSHWTRLTGKLCGKFDSGIRGTQPDRGLAYWADGKDKRILVGVMNFLYAWMPPRANQSQVSELRGWHRPPGESGPRPCHFPVYRSDQPRRRLQGIGDRWGRNPETLPALPVTLRATTCGPANCAGRFTPSRIPGEFANGTWPRDAWKTAAGEQLGWDVPRFPTWNCYDPRPGGI